MKKIKITLEFEVEDKDIEDKDVKRVIEFTESEECVEEFQRDIKCAKNIGINVEVEY